MLEGEHRAGAAGVSGDEAEDKEGTQEFPGGGVRLRGTAVTFAFVRTWPTLRDRQ